MNFNLSRALLLSVMLLTIQYAAIVHAVEHPFHTPDTTCSLHFAAERLGYGLVTAAVLPILPCLSEPPFFRYLARFYKQTIPYFLARAPPLFLHHSI
ncbi:MAG: hypothetical protein VSS75_015820 [Candidatus Parabeggiatoa sp.]|nr:hypothetical protein [Candidatus Parabeggiatoa sp.]